MFIWLFVVDTRVFDHTKLKGPCEGPSQSCPDASASRRSHGHERARAPPRIIHAMRWLALLVLIGVVGGHAATARADRASDLETWLRGDRVVSFAANRQTVVVERVGAILICARAHDGDPVCAIERDPAVHDVFVTYDSFHEEGSFHYCVSWLEADGVRRSARWDLRAPGTSGTCAEDYNVYGTQREAGRAGRFASLTTERVPLYASLDHHALPLLARGMRAVEDTEAICFAAPAGWICTPSRALYRALVADRIESLTPVGAYHLVHATNGHSHHVRHTLALIAFANDDLRLLDTLVLGHTIVLGSDPGPPYAWQIEGTQLVLTTSRPGPTSQQWDGDLAGRYRLEGGRFAREP